MTLRGRFHDVFLISGLRHRRKGQSRIVMSAHQDCKKRKEKGSGGMNNDDGKKK
jgi:hypothetical protein